MIYSELGGDPSSSESRFAPYDAQAWNMARSRFLLEVQRENSIHRQQTFHEKARQTEAELKTALRNCRTAADDRQILEATVLREQVSAGTMQREKTRIEEKTKQLEQENRALREQLQQGSDSQHQAQTGASKCRQNGRQRDEERTVRDHDRCVEHSRHARAEHLPQRSIRSRRRPSDQSSRRRLWAHSGDAQVFRYGTFDSEDVALFGAHSCRVVRRGQRHDV